MYEVNNLNQYPGAAPFVSLLDTDGNRTYLKTSTGI